MQGAIIPLAERYSADNPFLGVVLAGIFTSGALTQLRSHGFATVYIPYDSIVEAFRTAGVDASYDEGTPDSAVQKKVNAYNRLTAAAKDEIKAALNKSNKKELAAFFRSLEASLTRRVARILITALHGRECDVATVDDAVAFIERYDEGRFVGGFVRYEINVRYNNGDKIVGEFEDKVPAVDFLRRIC